MCSNQLIYHNLPATQETWVQSLGREDPLEEGMATHSSILAWRTCKDRGAWRATVHGVSESWTRLKRLSTHSLRSRYRLGFWLSLSAFSGCQNSFTHAFITPICLSLHPLHLCVKSLCLLLKKDTCDYIWGPPG